MKKIDFHVHYLTSVYRDFLRKQYGEKPEGFQTPQWDLEKQLQMMEENEIAYALLGLSSPYFSFGDQEQNAKLISENNAEIAGLVRPYEKQLGFLAALPLGDTGRALEEIEAALALGAKGFSFNTHLGGVYLGDPRLDPVMEKLNEKKSIVAIHPTKPAQIPEEACREFPIPAMEFFFDTTRTFVNMSRNHLFERYPDIRFIIPHAGALIPLLAQRIQVFFDKEQDHADLYRDLKHVYFDLAGYCEPMQLGLLLQVAPEEHLLYGSDFPYTKPETVKRNRSALEQTEKLDDHQKKKIFWENGSELLR